MSGIFTKFLTVVSLYLSIKLVLLIAKLFRFYIQSSTHVALAVLSLSTLTHLHYDLSWQSALLVFVFCATVGAYNFIRYYASLQTKASLNTPLLVFSFISALGLALSVTRLAFQTLLIALLLGLMSLVYVLPRNRFFGGLRYLPYVKSIIVAACWASVVVVLPLLNHQIEFDRATWFLWLQMVFWTIATMIPFEIRDINHDSESMKTIPQTFGIRGAKMIGSLMLFGVAVLSYLLSLEYDDMVPTLIASILAFVFLWKSTLHQSMYFASFWVEALPMAWLLSAVVWKWI